MAETDSTVSGTVTFETDDDLSETNIGAADAQGNRVDYVERGCGFSVNHTNDTITIGSTGTRANYAIVENPSSHVAWHLYPDQDTDIALPNASATNHVFIAYDESTDAISYHIDDDDTAPSEPSLKIGTVDTSADTSTETNRNPTIAAEQATIGGLRAREQVGTASPSSGSMTVSSISGYDLYVVEYTAYLEGTGDLFMRLNGDGSSTGNYGYWDESGTKSNGQNEYVLANMDQDFGYATGTLLIEDIGVGMPIQTLGFGGRLNRVTTWAAGGDRGVDETLSQVDISFGGTSFRDGRMVVKGAVR